MITLITGGMYGGKTSTAIQMADKYKRVGYFKHPKDTRDKTVRTHDGIEREAIIIEKASDITKCLPFYVCVFDEFQFFDSFIVEMCQKLSKEGKFVILAGLDRWHTGEHTERFIEFLKLTHCDIIYCYTKCSCGQLATHTKKIGGSKDQIIEVGSADLYLPVCKNCWSS